MNSFSIYAVHKIHEQKSYYNARTCTNSATDCSIDSSFGQIFITCNISKNEGSANADNSIKDLLNELRDGCWNHGPVGLKIASKDPKETKYKYCWGKKSKNKSRITGCQNVCSKEQNKTSDTAYNCHIHKGTFKDPVGVPILFYRKFT